MANDFRDSIYRSPFEMELRYLDRLYWVSILPFNMEAQLKTNWCWAATAKSVSRFYSRLTPWTQCKIASQELDKSCCDTLPLLIAMFHGIWIKHCPGRKTL